jgi:rhamnulokinase
MKNSPSFLAFDLGAESGRAVLGSIQENRLETREIHRFENGPVRVGDHLYWDVLLLWREILHGLKLAVQEVGGHIASLGVDTWGVDFGLLNREDKLVGHPYHYRDHRTDGMMDKAFQIMPRGEIYHHTGIQFMQLNSLYQLLTMVGSPELESARTFLNMPDLFNFWLCGVKANEFTIATTTQCYDPHAGNWADELLARFAIPREIFGPIVQPGTTLGNIHDWIAVEAGCQPVPVVATTCHDTASAVVAVPAQERDFIYLSSGTWSLMGTVVLQPVITERSMEFDLTNEGGFSGTFRLLKNIMGMWLLQECRREWSRHGKSYTYDDLTALAAAAPAFGSIILPGDSRFLAHGDMPSRIRAYCASTHQKVPESVGEIVRCIFESLALEYRRVITQLESITSRPMNSIHIIGGGSRNKLVNQLTADVTCKEVIAGPVEATAVGNILVQAIATGYLSTLEEGRQLVRNSTTTARFSPKPGDQWDEAYDRFLKLSRITA